jgi:hypothetical protein
VDIRDILIFIINIFHALPKLKTIIKKSYLIDIYWGLGILYFSSWEPCGLKKQINIVSIG